MSDRDEEIGEGKASTVPIAEHDPPDLELASLTAKFGKVAWDAEFMVVGGLIPFRTLKDPKEIKANSGSPYQLCLEDPHFTFSNFVGMGQRVETKLKVMLMMVMLESLQKELEAMAKTDEVVESLITKKGD